MVYTESVLKTELEGCLESSALFKGVHAVGKPFFSVGVESVLVSRSEVQIAEEDNVELLRKEVL